jgi:hypothetical protein
MLAEVRAVSSFRNDRVDPARVSATGAFLSEDPLFLRPPSSFSIRTVVWWSASTPAALSIGLVPDDVIGLIRYLSEQAASATPV